MPNDCDRIIAEAAAGRLDLDEMQALLQEFDAARRAESGLDSLEQRLFDKAGRIAEEASLAAALEKRNRLRNIVAFDDLKTMMREADDLTGNPALGLTGAMVGVNAPIRGGRDSVDAQALGILRETMGGLIYDLESAGLTKVYKSGSLDREINRELWDLSLEKPKGDATDSKQAKAIAAIVHRYGRKLMDLENRAGAYIRPLQGRSVRQAHNRARLEKAGQDGWAARITNRLDWERMEVPPERRPEFLKKAWSTLVSGKEVAGGDENDLLFAFKGPGNLAKRESAHRVLLFKSADEWFDYNEEFGVGNLRESVHADFSRAARNTALMRKFGTNPQAMLDEARTWARSQYDSDPKKIRALKSGALDNQMAELDGSVNQAQSHSLAAVGRSVRAWKTMSSLGGATLSSIGDPMFLAATRRFQGQSLAGSFIDAVMAPAQGLTSADQRKYGMLLGVGIDSFVGDVISRFAAQDDVPGRMSKLMSAYFKLNLLAPWTDGIKRGAGTMLARDLADSADVPFDRLDDAKRNLLNIHGFDARKWEVARLSISDTELGRMLLPGDVDKVRGAPFTGLSERQQQKLRDDVRIRLFAMFSDESDFAAPTPGARERAIMRQGLKAGTPGGEAIRSMMLFKSFGATVLTRPLGRLTFGRGTKAYTGLGAIVSGDADILGLVTLISSLTVMGTVAYQAKEVAKGREPREFSGDLLKAGFLQGGGAGIYGDFLFGEFNRFGQSFPETLAGPIIGGIGGDAAKLWASALEGRDLGAQAVYFGKSNTPFINLFYTRTALDYLILYQLQEMANPGYLRRMERRAERENNQKYLMPPSRAIPRGGGDRIFEGVR